MGRIADRQDAERDAFAWRGGQSGRGGSVLAERKQRHPPCDAWRGDTGERFADRARMPPLAGLSLAMAQELEQAYGEYAGLVCAHPGASRTQRWDAALDPRHTLFASALQVLGRRATPMHARVCADVRVPGSASASAALCALGVQVWRWPREWRGHSRSRTRGTCSRRAQRSCEPVACRRSHHQGVLSLHVRVPSLRDLPDRSC